jgi:hypothetical protein
MAFVRFRMMFLNKQISFARRIQRLPAGKNGFLLIEKRVAKISTR